MNEPLILVIEDHPKIRATTISQLREEGFAAHGVSNAEDALAFLKEQRPELLLVDVRLDGMSGIEFLRQVNAVPAIVISGQASMTETVEALRLGVYDFIEKPFTRERLLQSVRNCLEHVSLKRELTALQSRAREQHAILGRSPQIAQLRDRIDRVAPTDARVLIRGESGTGKELVAGALHEQSNRHDRPFVKINCAAIPPHLIEDELFGHARGAFTDAKYAKAGLFEEAHGGTLFLDEIGDMELTLQSRLLRVLEDGKVRRVGETHDRQVDVRILAATNRHLEECIARGTFREDLYFRIATVPFDVPPLRERTGDITLLFAWFLDHFCMKNQRRRLTVDAEIFPILERYRWPGNVRELRNICEQLSIFGTDPVTRDQLPSSVLQESPARGAGLIRPGAGTEIIPLRDFKEQCEKEYIESVLRRTNWNFVEAARLLDIQRTYLHQKVTGLGIRRP
jgi:DNA-binding NtrC family response regulator